MLPRAGPTRASACRAGPRSPAISNSFLSRAARDTSGPCRPRRTRGLGWRRARCGPRASSAPFARALAAPTAASSGAASAGGWGAATAAPRGRASCRARPRPRRALVAIGARRARCGGVRAASGRGSGRRARACHCCHGGTVAGESVRMYCRMEAISIGHLCVLLFAPEANVLALRFSTA